MRIIAAVLFTTVLLAASGQLSAEPSTTLPSVASGHQALEQFLTDYRADRRIQSFSVAVARNGEILFSGAYGYQDHDAEELTTGDTSYLVASITKTFSAATLLAMEADGHLSLSDPFTSLSDWQPRCAWLAQSGIIFGGGETDDGHRVEPVSCDTSLTLEQVLSHRVNGTPGEAFLYNPVVFGRLSNWVEENTGRSWRQWMTEYVIEPAGLENTAAGWRDHAHSTVLSHLAPPFRHTDPTEDRDGITTSILPNPELNASSGIIASAEELVRYGSALTSGKVLDRPVLERMWGMNSDSPYHESPYALGWFREQWKGLNSGPSGAETTVVWHSGWWPDAYAGWLLIVPEHDLVIAAQGNTDGLRWENPLHEANIQSNPLVQRLLQEFLPRQ